MLNKNRSGVWDSSVSSNIRSQLKGRDVQQQQQQKINSPNPKTKQNTPKWPKNPQKQQQQKPHPKTNKQMPLYAVFSVALTYNTNLLRIKTLTMKWQCVSVCVFAFVVYMRVCVHRLTWQQKKKRKGIKIVESNSIECPPKTCWITNKVLNLLEVWAVFL